MKCHSLQPRNKVKYPRGNCPDPLEEEDKRCLQGFLPCASSDSTERIIRVGLCFIYFIYFLVNVLLVVLRV